MRSIESRIITLLILFILGVQVVGFVFLQSIQESKARSMLEAKLNNGEPAIQRLLDQQTATLTVSITKLVNDSKFVHSILIDHQNDRNKVESALTAHAEQLGASMAWIVNMKGRIQAVSTQPISTRLRQLSTVMVSNSKQQGHVSTIVVDNHIPIQLIATLLRTSTTEVWVMMAFPLDKKFISEVEKATLLSATILVKNKQHWQVVDSSLSEPEALMLAKNTPERITSDAKNLMLNGKEYSVQMLALDSVFLYGVSAHGASAHRVSTYETVPDPLNEVVIILQGSISDILVPYSKLQIGLIAITLASLIIAISGNITFTKRISQPLRQLSHIAKRLGDGDYHFPIQVNGDEEIRDLAHAFVSMRNGIAQRENEIKRLAYWDMLTDLPNRAQFTSLLKEAIAANVVGQTCFVLLMDLDRFKHVNDVMGHSFGDLLLKKVANRLREALPGAQLARLGGDEFALLLPNSNLAAAQQAAVAILLLLEQPITLEDQAVDLAAGIGLAGYPQHGEDAESLLSHAEVAMYAAKRKVGNNFMVYSAEIDQSSHQNLSLLSELRNAIAQDQLRMYVQPKFSLDEKEIVGVEALIRWMHPIRGFLAPYHFIPFAEQTGIIRLLTRWVLDKSAALCAELIARGIDLKISVNISTHDLLDQDLPVKFAGILTLHRVKTSSFCLEITESAIMHDPHRAQLTLERLNAMGVELSIDDFGTGYSSLAYLKRLPVRELKIDRSFVMHIENEGDDRKIVKSTIDLGHNMGLRVVAEGVENATVMRLLTQMGCDQVQGNYIKPAIPAEELINWLERRETLVLF